MEKNAADTRQTRLNFYTNIVTLVVNMLIAFIYTPYLVRELGVSAYGILPLALIINQYIGIATGTLTGAYTRFYSVALQKGNYEEAARVLSTSTVSLIIISVALVPILILIITQVDSIFTIPSVLINSTKLLFIYTGLSFFVSLFSSLLNVTLYSLNRLDLINYIKIVRNILKIVLVWCFFYFVDINVAYVGLTGLMTEVVVLLISILLYYLTKPRIVKIKFSYYNKEILGSILAMSLWVLFQQLGDTLLYRTDNLLVNHYLGIEASGRLGAISEMGSYIMVIVNVIGILFGPLIVIAYSKNNHNEVKFLASTQSKIVGCLSALLCGSIAGVGAPLLSLWLNPSFGEYNSWLTLKLIPLPFYAAGGILAFVYRAWNKVRLPAILTIFLGIVDLLIIMLLCYIFPSQITNNILVTSSIFTIIQSFIMNAYCVVKIYPDCKNKFVPVFFNVLIIFFLSYIISRFLTSVVPVNNFYLLLIELVISGILSFVLMFLLFFNKVERRSLIDLIK